MSDKTSRIYTLIGAGGTGSILFPQLLPYLTTYHAARNEPFQLAIIDGDSVASTNLSRQLFAGRFVDENKAEALLAMHQPDPDLVVAVPHYIGAKNVEELIQDGDTLLIAVDNFPVRSFIEKRGATLDNIAVINGGNEELDGSCQLWVRQKGKNVTPPLSHCHPEIHSAGPDRAALSCQQIADLPGGGQTIVANSMSATSMLNMLRILHEWEANPKQDPHHEMHFDLSTLKMRPADNRGITGWN